MQRLMQKPIRLQPLQSCGDVFSRQPQRRIGRDAALAENNSFRYASR
jgi:hypothetical protein